MVANNLKAYVEAPTRRAKSDLISSVVVQIRQGCHGGGFIRKGSDERWTEVGPKIAREKVSHAFRDALLKSARNQDKVDEVGKRQHTWKEAQDAIFSALNLLQSHPVGAEDGTSIMMGGAEEARFDPPGSYVHHNPCAQLQPPVELQTPFFPGHYQHAIATTSIHANMHAFNRANNIGNCSSEPSDDNQINGSLAHGRIFPPWN